MSDSLPDLIELEDKIGRKTPESLLVWMRDAALLDDGWSSDVVDRIDHNSIRDSFSDKIRNLKLEMVKTISLFSFRNCFTLWRFFFIVYNDLSGVLRTLSHSNVPNIPIVLCVQHRY